MSEQPPSTPEPLLFSTMKIVPQPYTLQKSGNRLRSILLAVAGLLYLLRRERSIQWLALTTFLIILLALWLEINVTQFVELLLAMGLVWITETLNTAIEAAVNVAAEDTYHPMAKVGKDVASTATLISSFLALIVMSMILLPPLFERLF
jgi:diacylglycerol kinase